MKGRVCLVTGANSGIGKVTALELAKKGAIVVMVCRNPDKGQAATQEIREKSGNPSVDLLLADLSSQASIRQLVKMFVEKYPRLHVLINNAGLQVDQRTCTVDGIETTWAVNHLAPFLLTNLLLDVLKASAPARIVNISSVAHQNSRMDWRNLQGEKSYKGMEAYSRSKLATILFTYELARRLAGTGVTANVLHPGMVMTGVWKDVKGLSKWFMFNVLRSFFVSVEQGAQTPIYLAVSPEVEGVSGKYFVKQKPAQSSPASYDEAAAKRLWEISARLTGLEESTTAHFAAGAVRESPRQIHKERKWLE